MTHFLRLAAASALTLLALSVPAFAQADFGLGPASSTGSYLAGQQALQDLRTADAVKYFKQAATEDWDNPQIIGRAFMAYAANGQIEDAAQIAPHALDLDPGNEMARLVLATEALKQRRYPAAVKYLAGMGSDSFEGITGAILAAWALTGDGKIDEGFKLLNGIADGGLEDFLTFHRAIMADVAGRSAEAIDLTATAYDADPYVVRIVEAYARMLGNAGRFDEAIDVIVNYESRGLTHPLVESVKQALLKKQRPGRFANSVQAGAAEMFHSVGVALASEGGNDVALVFMRLAVYLDPSADVISLVLGQLYDIAGQHESANAIYDAIVTSSPMKPMAIVRIADNLDAMGDRPGAIARLTNIIALNPGDLDAIIVLGDLLRADKQFGESAAAYSKAIAVTGSDTPRAWRFFYARGMAYERNKEWPKAEADFQQALKLNPDQPEVLNYLGYSWVDQGLHLDEALAMIEKAVAAAPNDAYIIDSLGWAFYRLGRYDEAVAQLEQAVTIRPNDPEINDHLGDAYWQAGRKREARFQWNVASAVDEEGTVKARVAPKLAGGLDAAPETEDSAPVIEAPAAAGDTIQ